MAQQGVPVIVVVGIDPDIHEIPALLSHHLRKMQKDFLISFVSSEDLSDKTGEALKNMLTQSKFVPELRKLIEPKKPDIQIVSH